MLIYPFLSLFSIPHSNLVTQWNSPTLSQESDSQRKRSYQLTLPFINLLYNSWYPFLSKLFLKYAATSNLTAQFLVSCLDLTFVTSIHLKIKESFKSLFVSKYYEHWCHKRKHKAVCSSCCCCFPKLLQNYSRGRMSLFSWNLHWGWGV